MIKQFIQKLHLHQILYLLFTLLIIALDQYSKHWALEHLFIYEPKAIINGFFNLTLARNTGAAFSFLDSASGWQSTFFLYLNLFVSLCLLIWLFSLSKDNQLKSFALAIIVGGAVGNIIDRIQLGYVVDFLDFYISDYHWPIFNIADSAVCVGVILLLCCGNKKEVL
jgi:signal peptidase II